MTSAYREHRFENLNKMNFPGVGQYGIPPIVGDTSISCGWIPFHFLRKCRPAIRPVTGVHFFIDDYQFSRVWTSPDAYLESIKQFGIACSPDFSLYTDMPLAMQIYNHYRKHWVAAYWQMHGARVIPSISWSTPDSYSWCFDGEPTQATVAVSSVGCIRNSDSRQLFNRGYYEMVERLRPTQVLFYGLVPPECEALVPITKLPVFSDKFTRGCSENGG